MNIELLETYRKITNILGEQPEKHGNDEIYWMVGTDIEFQKKITLLYRDDKVKLFTEPESSYEEYIKVKDITEVIAVLKYALINNLKIG